MKIFLTIIKTYISVIFLLKMTACNFGPGSYSYAETYELNYSEEKTKKAINDFKQENPDFLVPKTTIKNQGSYDLVDEPIKEPSYWYCFYFYYKNENKIILTLTRSVSKDKSLIAFVSINEGLDLGHWKDINKNFSSSQDDKEKRKFEERILNKIKEKLNQ
ncbi:MAG: hypothetical protein ABJA37_04375 [Ferruginibacter sp.]